MTFLERELLGQRNRQDLAGAAFGDPQSITRRLHSGWCVEPFLKYGNARLISIDCNGGNFARAIFSNDQLAVGCTHTIWSLYRLVHPNVYRRSGLTRSIYGNAVEIVGDYVVHIKHAVEKGNAIHAH